MIGTLGYILKEMSRIINLSLNYRIIKEEEKKDFAKESHVWIRSEKLVTLLIGLSRD